MFRRPIGKSYLSSVSLRHLCSCIRTKQEASRACPLSSKASNQRQSHVLYWILSTGRGRQRCLVNHHKATPHRCSVTVICWEPSPWWAGLNGEYQSPGLKYNTPYPLAPRLEPGIGLPAFVALFFHGGYMSKVLPLWAARVSAFLNFGDVKLLSYEAV